MSSVPICRVCLRSSLKYIDLEAPFELDTASPLPVDDSTEAVVRPALTYLDCFRSCTRLEVAACEKNVPQSLCDACGLELTIAYSFLQKALKADTILQQVAFSTNVEAAATTIKEEIEVLDVHASADVTNMSAGHLLEAKSNTCYEKLAMEESKNVEEEAQELESIQEVALSEMASDDIYICSLCDESFNSQCELNSHLKQSHEDNEVECTYSYEVIEDSNQENDAEEWTLKEHHVEEAFSYSRFEEGEECYELLEIGDVDENDEPYGSDTQCEGEIEVVEAKAGLMEDDNLQEAEEPKVVDHINTLAVGDSLKCGVCLRDFSSQRAFLQHWKKHRPALLAHCKVCNKPLPKTQTMREHLQLAHSEIVQCHKCDYKCKESKMPEHERRAHAGRHNFSCTVCTKSFSSSSMLKSHLKYHQRKEANIKSDACEICGKQFSTQHYLRQHMEVHRNERQLHQCEYCDKIYVTKTALDNHIRLHKGETITCQECGKQFARQYELNVHMRFHTRDYPFTCDVCGKKFAIKGHLRTHMWRHQGLKLQCEDCGKLFTSTKALQEHSFVHTEMPFPCCYCGRGYPSKQKFKVHLRTTHLIELNEEELQKVAKPQAPRPLQRKKLTLVQADSVMKEVEVKAEGANESIEEILVELC